ncbi:VanZ like family protein [Selenomonas ruminantium]|uniref:VanZ like family protein n=1 Tax=Selenomonas ruminantium TaxID=971 RepID=A0A1I3GPW8_SELRU|nr:VanZ family protein [Selenomonas ruminantium]SFI25414.1 VanZ like family protein [Selenomonas ruminantium]
MKITRKAVVFLLLTILVTAFIWHNSLQDAVNSREASKFFDLLLVQLVKLSGGTLSWREVDHFVRKLAHFTEFALLGMMLRSFFAAAMNRGRQLLSRCTLLAVCLCAMVAGMDEYLQQFSPGRSCQLSDVALDSSGALMGILVVELLFYLLYRFLPTAD